MNNNLTTNATDEAVNPRFCKGAVIGSWVMANERLPERIKYHKLSEEVILTDGVKAYAGYYGYGINKWCSNSVDEKRTVIAWMPMPLPNLL